MAIGSCGGNAQRFGRLVRREPGEVAQLHEFGALTGPRQPACRVPRPGPATSSVAASSADRSAIDSSTRLAATTAFQSVSSAGLSTRIRRIASAAAAKKWPRLSQCWTLLHIHQPDVRLMHQRRGLQRLVRLLLGHFGSGQFPQFVVDQRQELLGRLTVRLVRSARECASRRAIRRLGHWLAQGTVGSGSSPAASPRESSWTIAVLHCPRNDQPGTLEVCQVKRPPCPALILQPRMYHTRVVDTSFGRRHIDESLVEEYCGCDGCQRVIAPVTRWRRQASPSSRPLLCRRTG